MSAQAAEDTAVLFSRAREALIRLVPNGTATNLEALAFWVPGRIEFLGKHTDYAGGRSLLCAIERGIGLLVVPRADRRLRIVDAGRTAAGEIEIIDTVLDAAITPVAGHWATYPLAVARRVARNFAGPLHGADIAFASDLPAAAGMSSSSALVIATFLALADVNRLSEHEAYRRAIRTPADLAGYLGTIENGQSFGDLAGDAGVGTFGGSEDHTAILCARPDALVQYAFCPVRFERVVPLPVDHAFVVASSGVIAEKTGAARERYNRAASAVQHIVARWNETTGRDDTTLADAITSGADALVTLRAMLARAVADGAPADGRWTCDRFEQFVRESTEIIPAAADALARGDLLRLGALVDRSQDAAERLLGNQTPETVWLARSARTLGAAAASAFGAGFGGSVWALLPAADVERFGARWADAYAAQFPAAAARAEFFGTRAGPAAARV